MLSGCIPDAIVPPAPWQNWLIDDVLWLSSAPTNQNSLIAAYFRKAESSCQFRFDLLNYSSADSFDLQVLIFLHSPVINIDQPDFTISLPSNSEPFLLKWIDSTKITQGIQVFQNPAMDAIVLQLSNVEICEESIFSFQAEVITEDNYSRDTSPLIYSYSSPPRPAYLLFAFWDTLPASTPIQLIRRWDGAHTGPFGQRHGLKILAEAAEKFQVPLFLLDLKQPDPLAGLELLGQTNWIRQLQQSDLIFLPDSTWGSNLARDDALGLVQQVSDNYHFRTSQLYFSPDGSASTRYLGYFGFTQNPSPVLSDKTYRIIPLPYAPEQAPPEWITQSVTAEGLSEHTLRVLLSNASQAEDRTILALGGSLTSSPLADITVAESVMSYIAAHPWIQVVTQNDLMSFPSKSENALSSQVPSTPTTLEKEVFSALKFSPVNEFSTSALDMFLNLTDIDNLDPSYPILQSYLPQIYNLLEASNWVEKRGVRNECQLDLDTDGSPECVLSNTDVFLILDPLGGRLEFSAGCNSSGSCSQIIGFTNQLAASISDPSSWNINHPYNQDPMVIPGALDDQNTIPIRYTFSQGPDTVSFSDPETSIVKTYTLVPYGFKVQVATTNPQTFLIPLIFEPDIRYWPNWPHQVGFTQISPNRFSWGQTNKNYLEIEISGAEYKFTSFNQTISTLRQSENPDFAFSDIFFKPYPLALIQIEPSDEWNIHISLR